MDIILLTELTRRIGSDILNIGHPWGGKSSTSARSASPATGRIAHRSWPASCIARFFAAFKYSDWGVAMRAAAEDGEAAALMGIRLGRVAAWRGRSPARSPRSPALFLVGVPDARASTPASVSRSPCARFPAAILGGLDSTGGALVGGLLIGVTESLAAGYQDQLSFLGRGFGEVVPYVVMIIVLLVRPSGLFGTKELTRV